MSVHVRGDPIVYEAEEQSGMSHFLLLVIFILFVPHHYNIATCI